MRHTIAGKKLNRDTKERKALFRSLVLSLIEKEKIKTTLPKGQVIVRLAEKLVTAAKNGTQGQKRKISAFLSSKSFQDKLTGEIAPQFSEVTGGYVRMVKLGRRTGDGAQEVMLSWSRQIPKKETAKKTAKKSAKKEIKREAKKETKKPVKKPVKKPAVKREKK